MKSTIVPSFDDAMRTIRALRKRGEFAHYAPLGGDIGRIKVQPVIHRIVILSSEEILKGMKNEPFQKR